MRKPVCVRHYDVVCVPEKEKEREREEQRSLS
jgi:hypothetical protein